jgi:carbamoyltransferase
VLVIDGGGYDDQRGTTIATSIWSAPDRASLHPVEKLLERDLNIGGIWTRATRYVFGLESGWPQGHQAGSVMAMAALGDPSRFSRRFHDALTIDRRAASAAPIGHIKGMSARDPLRPTHPYFADLEAIAKRSPQDAYDLAAGLQNATEQLLLTLVDRAAQASQNICITGGVALNTAFIGRLLDLRPQLNIFVPPVPYDAGLCVGAARHMLHIVDRVPWTPSVLAGVPYRGGAYSLVQIDSAIAAANVSVSNADDDDVLKLLAKQQIVAVFTGRSESGRRALGHRSILADPRDPMMKDRVNANVKHRQSYRPFAPSVLREHVGQWFKHDVSSPFMTTVVQVLPERAASIPAVLHADSTARLQTLTSLDNGWYYRFVHRWYEMTGIPMLLNTSFNDREPICESPEHAITCFQNTSVDALYFADYGRLVTRRSK